MSATTTELLYTSLRTALLAFQPAGGATPESLGALLTGLWVVQGPDNVSYPYGIMRLQSRQSSGEYSGDRETVGLELTLYDRPRKQQYAVEGYADVAEQALLRYTDVTSGLVFARSRSSRSMYATSCIALSIPMLLTSGRAMRRTSGRASSGISHFLAKCPRLPHRVHRRTSTCPIRSSALAARALDAMREPLVWCARVRAHDDLEHEPAAPAEPTAAHQPRPEQSPEPDARLYSTDWHQRRRADLKHGAPSLSFG